jgi:hypothetical protein
MGREASARAVTRGDLNCAAALEERTTVLTVLEALIQVSFTTFSVLLRFVSGS